MLRYFRLFQCTGVDTVHAPPSERTPEHPSGSVRVSERVQPAEFTQPATMYNPWKTCPDSLMDTSALFDPCALHRFVIAQHHALVTKVDIVADPSLSATLSPSVTTSSLPTPRFASVRVCNLYGATLACAAMNDVADKVSDTLARVVPRLVHGDSATHTSRLHDWVCGTDVLHVVSVVHTVPYLHATWAHVHGTPTLTLVVWTPEEERHTVLPNYTRWLRRVADPPVTFATMCKVHEQMCATDDWRLPHAPPRAPQVQKALLRTIVQRAAQHWRVVRLRAVGCKG